MAAHNADIASANATNFTVVAGKVRALAADGTGYVNIWKEEKSGDGYVSAVHCISRKYTLNLFARAYNNKLIAAPEEHQDLSGTITYIGKWWKKAATKATDFIQLSANDLGMPDHIRGKIIGDDTYFWEGDITFVNTGKSAGIFAARVLDALSATHYET